MIDIDFDEALTNGGPSLDAGAPISQFLIFPWIGKWPVPPVPFRDRSWREYLFQLGKQ